MSRCSCIDIKVRAPSNQGRRPAPVLLDLSPERSVYRRLLLSEHLRWRATIATIAAEALLCRQSNLGFRKCGHAASVEADRPQLADYVDGSPLASNNVRLLLLAHRC